MLVFTITNIFYIFIPASSTVSTLTALIGRRAAGVSISHPDWVLAMATLINSKKPDVFRWHDSGDVQDAAHLNKIFEVCRLTPNKRHWMPTREAWIKDHMHKAPANLVVRFSSPMVDQGPVKSWANTSTVSTKSRSCPAPDQDNACGSCRACWDPLVKNIEYGKH